MGAAPVNVATMVPFVNGAVGIMAVEFVRADEDGANSVGIDMLLLLVEDDTDRVDIDIDIMLLLVEEFVPSFAAAA